MGLVFNDGYEYVSDNGIRYSLYELKTLGGRATPDICFIMNDQYCEIDEDVYKNGKTYKFGYEAVGWFYGASLIQDSDWDEYVTVIEEMVDDYEKENPDIVELIKAKEAII